MNWVTYASVRRIYRVPAGTQFQNIWNLMILMDFESNSFKFSREDLRAISTWLFPSSSENCSLPHLRTVPFLIWELFPSSENCSLPHRRTVPFLIWELFPSSSGNCSLPHLRTVPFLTENCSLPHLRTVPFLIWERYFLLSNQLGKNLRVGITISQYM